MRKPNRTHNDLLASLQERAKELNCLFEVEELLSNPSLSLDQAFQSVVKAMAPGWQYPDICRVVLTCEGQTYRSADFEPSEWILSAIIRVQDSEVGTLSVYYIEERPREDTGPFLKDEVRLLNSIADRLGHYAFHKRMQDVRQDWTHASSPRGSLKRDEWRAPIHLLRESDKDIYLRIARKMTNHLLRIGVEEAQALLPDPGGTTGAAEALTGELNIPGRRCYADNTALLSDRPFELASKHLSDDEILARVQKWMQEDKASSFMEILNSQRSSLPELVDAIRRFHHNLADGSELPDYTQKSMRVSLTQRLLTEQLDFVRVAKEYLRVSDFSDLLDRVVLPPESHGKLGGKSAGLFLAHKILQRTECPDRPVGTVKVPKTWYLASDGLLDFVSHNDLQDTLEQKFKEIDQVRDEYRSVIQLFKSSSFTPRVINGLSVALDDLADIPLIIRSSSLLEDRLGTAFSGKYKSLFVANQGSKQQRLETLMDAIAEVYASTFGPDPIEYRREHGLLEFNEEMGILIQEVVGTRLGKYYLPAFAGVAFSKNEFRWSPRIERDDGLVRLVPGLGTRAVDRVSDDYAVLVVPGKPNLRVNAAIDEVIRYAPKKIDVINMETRTLETIEIQTLLRECGSGYPALEKVFSLLKNDMLQKVVGLMLDLERDEIVPTFNGLLSETPFIKYIGNIMSVLEEHLGTPVDIEFAHDGTDFYLLQCRPQSYAADSAPAPIPKDIPKKDIVFSADRYVSNGWMSDITHIVYVDPMRYAELGTESEMRAVGRVVGRLNKLLPKRQFILMGPGRWGSRGDIRLGVSVTYADISNTAMLIEIARQKGGYVPDLSFGTHFFQDLVESSIRYLPLYPDDEGIVFNERFLLGTSNLLSQLVPDCKAVEDTVHVIDVPAVTGGRVLRVPMNADLNEALGMLVAPDEDDAQKPVVGAGPAREPLQYWSWRLKMAEQIAAEMEPDRFGVEAIYIFGSTKNATAGPGSDIDLLIHFRGSEEQRRELMSWLKGWSLCLGEVNYLRTGYRTRELLDIHIVTDQDIAERTSYAVKIGAITDAARELQMNRVTNDSET
ncbi:MAG: nucleotidyltransferase domain-containing protein [Candidatus Eisenbacteria sp.]|nr:nucleotidyltransferase domain-containing protein [Candidatus Eisenbacteria bacterium]